MFLYLEYLIQKIEEHEKNGYYHWWTPCLLEKGYKENMNKCKGNRNQNQKEIFSDLENLFFHIPNQTEAIIESLKKEKSIRLTEIEMNNLLGLKDIITK